MSGRKNVLSPYHLMTAGDMSGDLTSNAVNIQYQDNFCVQLIFTGTPTGSFKVQGSVDHAEVTEGGVTRAGNWVDLTLSPSPGAAGAANTILIDLNQLSFPWIRVKYVFTSGTGSLDIWVGAKSV